MLTSNQNLGYLYIVFMIPLQNCQSHPRMRCHPHTITLTLSFQELGDWSCVPSNFLDAASRRMRRMGLIHSHGHALLTLELRIFTLAHPLGAYRLYNAPGVWLTYIPGTCINPYRLCFARFVTAMCDHHPTQIYINIYLFRVVYTITITHTHTHAHTQTDTTPSLTDRSDPVLHGDIKSLNYLTTNGGKVIKLADLGMAKTTVLLSPSNSTVGLLRSTQQSLFSECLFKCL